MEGNSVAIVTFDLPTNLLAVESEVIIQQLNEAPLEFLVADYAIEYPFTYQSDDQILLSPYMASPAHMTKSLLVGWIANFVSGYFHAPPSTANLGATHAWAEVHLPGAVWKGFDPTVGEIAGTDHFAVAVARLPASVPPIAGSFVGSPGSSLDVGVWVTKWE